SENGGQTLMVLPDIMVFMSGFAEIPGGPGDKISATGLIRSMQGFLGLNQQKTGNWMIVNSTDVDNALWGNRPRKELTRLFASLNGSNAGEAWQEYTASVDGMPFYDMGYLFGAVLMGQSPDFGMNQQNSMGPIYYALTKDQRTQLRNGVPIAVGGLTPAQKEKVRFLTYGAKSLYKCVTQDVVDSYSKMDAAQQLQNSEYLYQNGGNGLYIQNLREDPTVSLPTGLPDRAVIVARPISKQVVAVFDNPEGTGYSYDQDTYSIAWDLFQHERPELFPGENNRKASYYRLGQKQVLHMRVDFDKTRALYGSIELMATGTKEKPVPFDKLPDSVKKEALEQVKQYRESYKDAKPGQFGGGRGSIPKP
ncbi:MAG: hypothetical protein K8R88_03135, partial [Armatimonadetes bacterium]|nr:hypothetical protein [Armatimonadota bacterium]